MRQIKFRGKDCIGQWRYGNISLNEVVHNGKKMVVCSMSGIYDDFYCSGIDPETVGQFTGLTDKNGTEIYEGDILLDRYEDKCEETGYGETYNEVAFRDGAFGMIGEIISELLPFCDNPIRNEVVVGNIYDNKDLLE